VSEARVEPAPRIVFVNRFFAPDHSATSQILSDLAFCLASKGREVHVVCGDNLYADPAARLRKEEILGGVHVHRVSGGRFGRSGLAGRAADYVGLYASLRGRVSALLRAGDILVVKTDPPLLTIPLAGLARKRGAAFVPWLQDIYPEVATALGVPFVRGPIETLLAALRDRSLMASQRIVAIGECMRRRLCDRGLDAARVHVIPNWSDDRDVVPVGRDENPLRTAWGLAGKFVVGYSGNMGRAHEFDTFIAAAEQFKGRNDVTFLFIGGGHHVGALKAEAKSRGIEDLLQFQPYQAREVLSQSLSVPDVHWLSLRPELEGLIVPSKFYGIAAVGRPVINVGAQDGEVAFLILRHQCGVTIQPGDGAGMAAAIARFVGDPATLQAFGQNGRRMLVDHFSKDRAMARWGSLLEECVKR
jgi:glycosyltransferase involved in cell wall biosynthesis